MKKKEWLNRAQQKHDKEVSAFCNASIGLQHLIEIIEESPSVSIMVTLSKRSGEQNLTQILKEIKESVDLMQTNINDFKELSKGLIHSVPDDIEIREPMSMFE